MAEDTDIVPLQEEKDVPAEERKIFSPDGEEQTRGVLRKFLIPANTPLSGRSGKFRDVFVVGGAISISGSTTTVSTDANGTTQTNLTTFAFRKDELHEGMLVRVTAIGTYTSDATRTVTVRVGSGTAPTTEWNSMVSTAASATTQPWHLVWTGIITANGSSGTIEAQMVGKINNVNKDDPNTGTVSVNTTAAITLAVTAQWSDTTAGNSIIIRQFVIELI